MLARWLIRAASHRTLGRNLALVWFLLGAFHVVWSQTLGLATVTYEGREVGFLFSLNWSAVYVAVLPLAIFLLLDLMDSALSALRGLVRKGVVVRERGGRHEPVTDEGALVERFEEALAFPAWT